MNSRQVARALKPTSRPVKLLVWVFVAIWLVIALWQYRLALLIFMAWMLFVVAGQALIRWLWQRMPLNFAPRLSLPKAIGQFIQTVGSVLRAVIEGLMHLLLAIFMLGLMAGLLIMTLQLILLLPALLFPDNDLVRLAVEWLYDPFQNHAPGRWW